jgi:hypothetical protein
VGIAFIPSRAQHLLRDATVLKLQGKEAKWRVGLAWPSARTNAITARFVSFVRTAKLSSAQSRATRSHSATA